VEEAWLAWLLEFYVPEQVFVVEMRAADGIDHSRNPACMKTGVTFQRAAFLDLDRCRR
jgi:hypothetical protein